MVIKVYTAEMFVIFNNSGLQRRLSGRAIVPDQIRTTITIPYLQHNHLRKRYSGLSTILTQRGILYK